MTRTDPIASPDRARLADAILSSSLDCIIVSDAGGRIVEFNGAAERTFGWQRSEILGRTMEDTIVPHRHREAHRHGMARFLAGGGPRVIGRRVEIEGLHADGHEFPVELSICETEMDGGRYFVATLRDLSERKRTETDLRQARASLQAIFDNIPAALYLRDRDDNLVMINSWGAQFLGRDPAEMIGQPMANFREPQNTAGVRVADASVVRDRKPLTREFTYHLPGGDRVGLMTFFPIMDEAGEVTQIGGMMMDATDLHRARLDLQQSRASLQAFFDDVPVGIHLNRIGPGGLDDQTVEFANDNMGKPYGVTGAELIGRDVYAFYRSHGSIERERAFDRDIVASGKPGIHEGINALTGRYESYTRFPIRNAAGAITHMGGINIDVDAKVRSELQLTEFRTLLEAVFDNIPAELYLRDLQGSFIMMNKWGAAFYGSDSEGMKGRSASEFDSGAEIDIARQAQERLLATGQPVVQEYNYSVGGRNVVVSNTIFPVRDSEGRITRIGGVTTDVTELHQARNALQEARHLLQSIFDNVPAVLYLRELDGRLITVNRWGAAVMGVDDPAKAVGLQTQMLDNEEQRETARRAQDQVLATGKPATQEYRRMVDGRETVVLNSIFPVRDTEGGIVRIGGFASDVTELYQARNELQEARNLLQTIFDNVPAELYLRRLDGQYLMANQWTLDFYGLSESDLPNLTAETFDTGDEVAVSRQAQRELMATGRPVTREYHHKARGRDVVILNTIFPLRNAEGEIDRIGGVSTDITELNSARSQLQRAQDSLHQSEKLAALGQLLAGVAHELNNPLAVVLGRAAILQEKLEGTPHAAPLQKLREAANRCARIVKTFLAMARQTGPRRQLVAVNDLIDAALEMTTYSLRTTAITWNVTPLDNDRRIEADEDQIVQVLINLILNAQSALENHAGPRQIDIGAAISRNGAWLDIVVADSGPGVAEAIAGRIFEPFFTTKAVGQGTGLGLSVCKSMVEAHGGKLTLEPTPGGGATFRITLPALTGPVASAGDDTGTGGQQKALGRILIVDDEIEIAAILADCLTPLGIDCVIASDGRAALDRLGETTFDGIFCDVSMPGMDGLTFYRHLKDSNPLLAGHLVFVSGNVLHRDWDSLKSSVDRPVIEKPFDPQLVRDAAMALLAPEGRST